MAEALASFSKKNFRLIHFLVIAIFVLGILFGVFSYFQKASLNRAISSAQKEISAVSTEIQTLKEEKLQAAVIAQEILSKIDAEEFHWSEIIDWLISKTPVDVFYLSYSGSSEGTVSVNALTSSFSSVSSLIQSLEKEPHFQEIFVPSITKGEDEAGQPVLSFGVNFKVQLESKQG